MKVPWMGAATSRGPGHCGMSHPRVLRASACIGVKPLLASTRAARCCNGPRTLCGSQKPMHQNGPARWAAEHAHRTGHDGGRVTAGRRICSRFRRGAVHGPCYSFCCKLLTRRARRTTEQHGEAFLVGHAAANPRAAVTLMHSMLTHVAAISTAPCRSVVLRARRVKCLRQNETLGLTATAVSLAGNHADFRQIRLPWGQRRSAR